jgi:glycosyltransferase involved in cell wall biosynthesis
LGARWSERLLGRMTDAVIALAPRQARDLVDVHRVLPADRVRVISPGMDLRGFRRRAQMALTKQPLGPGGVPRFLWTGRYVPVKDPRLLVEAVAHASVPFHLTMLGRGPLLDSVRATVRAHGLEGRISCPGPVSDVAPWLHAADALVLCSRSEGTPLSVIEAMALGKPVVVTTVGGLPDMIEHEGTGLWVPPRDPLALAAALDRLAAEPELRLRLGQAGRAEVDRRFGAERLARDTAALYEQVLERRRTV